MRHRRRQQLEGADLGPVEVRGVRVERRAAGLDERAGPVRADDPDGGTGGEAADLGAGRHDRRPQRRLDLAADVLGHRRPTRCGCRRRRGAVIARSSRPAASPASGIRRAWEDGPAPRRTSKHWILRAARPVRKYRQISPGAAPHRPVGDPQLLHHRAHRPRQVDAGRPDAAAHRRGRRPHDARAVPRPDGHRARARHHHQEPGRAAAVHRARRPHLRAEHDRHPGARRLHLRGVPLAGRLRGLRPARRRGAGHRGADPGQPLPRARERPADHPGAQQDRPAVGAAGEVRRRARAHHRLRPGRRAAGSAPRPARGSASCSTRSSAWCRTRSATRTRRPAR